MAFQTTRLAAVFDTETANIPRLTRSLLVSCQLSRVSRKTDFASLRPSDVRTELMRSVFDAYEEFDDIIAEYFSGSLHECPVVMVHNLAYDIHFLMDYLTRHEMLGHHVDCCFKTSIKPLTVTIKDGDRILLIFWDTLSFSGKSLKRMGEECGVAKGCGEWDYDKVRHLGTELTAEEEHYALQDTVIPWFWLKQWLEMNPEVSADQLAKPILTKTSVVRYKCKQLGMEGGDYGKTKYDRYLECCKRELPKTAVDYNLMLKATSAGWTFTAGNSAGITFENAAKYDATSMHPSHMVTHRYPCDFHTIDNKTGMMFFERVTTRLLEEVLGSWEQPFDSAFNGRFMFINLRPRKHSIFERDNLMLHGSALFGDYIATEEEDNYLASMEVNEVNAAGYSNVVVNPVYSFGKLVSADVCIITLNELNAWVHARVYDWDSVTCTSCSGTSAYRKPPEYVKMSVETMLERKKVVKDAMHCKMPEKRPEWVPAFVFEEWERGEADGEQTKAFYKAVKADLNSLYGMFATNECKEKIVYSDGDFIRDGIRGMEAMPEKPKAWYNFGLRIAAWSRVQQCIAMQLLTDAECASRFINGDTDSFSFEKSQRFCAGLVWDALRPLHEAIDDALVSNGCVAECFNGLGAYMVDCEPSEYCAVGNKRYAYIEDGRLHVASAGVPNKSVEYAICKELGEGRTFSEAVVYGVGYLAEYSPELSGTKYKAQPEYTERLEDDHPVTDYRGDVYVYPMGEQVGIFLAETEKTIGEGFEEDYRKCCENADIEYRGRHVYRL